MSTTPSRSRASLALATALALVAAMFSIGISPASAEQVFAKVTGHAAQSPTNNQVATWCGSDSAGKKIEPVSSSPYQLDDDYKLVVVKAGANQHGNIANTLFGSQPSKGQWVWADTNGNGQPEIGTGDKDSISHIIVCFKDNVTPPQGSIRAIKKWTVTGPAEYTDGKPGDLLLNDEVKAWNTSHTYAADTKVTVAEDTNGTPPTAEGWTCTIDDKATTYQVGAGQPGPTPPTVTIVSSTEVLVTITNVANCTEDITEPEQGSIEAAKEWTVTGLDPKTAPGFTAGTPGTLTFNEAVKPWTNNTTSYDEGTKVTVKEAGNGTPPTATGYTCTLNTAATTYTVGETTSTTAPTVTIVGNTTVKVTVTNVANCTKDIPAPPAKGWIEAAKEWTVTGLDPKTAPGFTAGTPGTLTFNEVVKPWTDNTTPYDAGTKVMVKEAGNGTPPTATGYTCTLNTGATTYTVGETTSTTAPTVTIVGNTTVKVTVTNTANCTKDIPPPPATTTLTVTKVWAYVGTPAGYPTTLTGSNAGALNVTVGGTATGQAWGATKADLKVGDKATVSEGPVPAPPTFTGYTCSITGSPEYAVNGGGFTTTAASFPLAPSPNTVTVRNTVTCVAEDSTVGGTEDQDTPTGGESDGSDDDQVVAGSEDELASTGANAGPAVLGLLLILSGAAFVTARRFALK